MITPSAAYYEALDRGRRIVPIMLVRWRSSTAAPLIVIPEALPGGAYGELRWEGHDGFAAGTFFGTYLRADSQGRWYVGLNPTDWSTWYEHKTTPQTQSTSSPWLGRLSDGDLCLVWYKFAIGDSGMIVQTSADNGQTWSSERNLSYEYGWSYPGNISPMVTVGQRTLFNSPWAGAVYYSDDNAATWIQTSASDWFSAPYSPRFIWGRNDQGKAWAYDHIYNAIWHTYDGQTWVGPTLTSGVTPGAGWSTCNLFGATWTGRRHIALAVADDGVSTEEIRLYALSDGGTAWELIATFPMPFPYKQQWLSPRLFTLADGTVFVSITGYESGMPATCWATWIARDDGTSFPPLARLTTLPEIARQPAIITAPNERVIMVCQRTADYTTTDPTLWFFAPVYNGSGTWTSQVGDTQEERPGWTRVMLARRINPAIDSVLAQFRAAGEVADVPSASWTPATGGWDHNDDASSLTDARYAQAKVTITGSTQVGFSPRLYAVGLHYGADWLESMTVHEWGELRIEQGQWHVQESFGAVTMTIGAKQAAYWPWEGAEVRIGLYPHGGRIPGDVLWLFSAAVDRCDVQGDLIRVWLRGLHA